MNRQQIVDATPTNIINNSVGLDSAFARHILSVYNYCRSTEHYRVPKSVTQFARSSFMANTTLALRFADNHRTKNVYYEDLVPSHEKQSTACDTNKQFSKFSRKMDCL